MCLPARLLSGRPPQGRTYACSVQDFLVLVSLGSLFFMCIWHGALAVMPLSHESSKYIDNRVIAGYGAALLLALLVITLWIYFVVRSPSPSLSLYHHPNPLLFSRPRLVQVPFSCAQAMRRRREMKQLDEDFAVRCTCTLFSALFDRRVFLRAGLHALQVRLDADRAAARTRGALSDAVHHKHYGPVIYLPSHPPPISKYPLHKF